MRTIIAAAIFTIILAAICPPLAAQTTQPVFLFLLEGKGVPTGTIHVFRVNSSTGAITEAPGSPFNAGLIPQSLAVDPTGRFLYVANQQSQDLTAFSVDASTGALTELPGSPVPIGSHPEAMGIDPTGRFLYVSATSAQGQGLFEFTIDGVSGVLTAAPSSPRRGLFATSIVFDPIGSYAYLSTGSPNRGMSNPILVCAIDFTSGMLTPVGAGQPAAGGSNVATISPSGGSLYSVDPVTSRLDAFTVGAGGVSLTETSASAYAVPLNPYSLVVHPSGNFLYVVNENQSYQTNETPSQYDGSISAFSINSGTGTLAPVTGSPFAAGINPLSIVVDPTGRFAYTTATMYTSGFTGFAQIMGFSVDPASGILTPLSWTPWTDAAQSNGGQLTISPGALTATNPAPMISSLLPSSTTATGVAFTLQVNGANFVPGATVYFGGLARRTAFVSATQLNASILGSDIDNGGTAVVFVFNPIPGGGASTSVEFPVFNPSPIISSIQPSSIAAGASPSALFVIGSNFVTSSVVNFNGTPRATSYVSPTLILTEIVAADITAPGRATISVTNPSNGVPGGGTSNTVTLTILPPNPPLAVSSISPTSATAGGPAFTLTVNGTGFVAGSQVSFNLNNVFTAFINSTQLTAAIPASAIAIAGNPYVIVTNPDGFTSVRLSFMVNPGIGSVTPPSLPAGSNALTLSVTGTGFVPGSAVLVNGTPRFTTYVSSTSLQATLLLSDLAQSGTLNITVMNPPPGGGTTPAISFIVADFNVSASSPSQSRPAGQPANYSLSLAAIKGALERTVTFSASGLPPQSTASFTPASVPAGNASTTVTLSVTTIARSSVFNPRIIHGRRPFGPFISGLALTIGMMWFALWTLRGRMGRAAPVLLMVMLLAMVAGLAACGGTVGAPANSAIGTPAGAYTITVNATSGSATISTKVTLTVM